MENQAYLRLYEDMLCNKELRKGITDDYVVSFSVPTGHSDLTYNKTIFVKNTGTHKAYNITVTKQYDSSNKATINSKLTSLAPKHSGKFKISIPYSKGEKKNYQISLNVEYDNIP